MATAKTKDDNFGFVPEENFGFIPEEDFGFIPDGQSGPAGTEKDPIESDIYNGNLNRIASSFGDTKGNTALLKSQGWKDVKVKDGEVLVQDADGKWHKDISGIKGAIERHLGEALPVLSGTAAGVYGLLGGPASVPSAIAGGMLGEGLRQAAGRQMGVYQGDLVDSLVDTGLQGAGSGLGKAMDPGIAYYGEKIAATPAYQAVDRAVLTPVKEGLTKGVSTLGEWITGVPSEVYQRYIKRPYQMGLAENPMFKRTVARNAGDELRAVNQLKLQEQKASQKAFDEKFATTYRDTTDILNQAGPLTKEELDGLTTTEILSGIDPSSRANKIVYERFPNGSPKTVISQPEVSWTPLKESKLVYGKPSKQTFYRNPYYTPFETEVSTVEPKLIFDKRKSAVEVIKPEVSYVPIEGVENKLPYKNAVELRQEAKRIQDQIRRWKKGEFLPGEKVDQAQAKRRYGLIKDDLHQLDPDGLAATDLSFSDPEVGYQVRSGRLSGLQKQGSRIRVINNMFGKSNEDTLAAAQELIPNSMPAITDVNANRLFNIAANPRNANNFARKGVTAAAGGTVGAIFGDSGRPGPSTAAGGIAALALSHPSLWRAMIKNAAITPWSLMARQALEQSAVRAPWTLMNE